MYRSSVVRYCGVELLLYVLDLYIKSNFPAVHTGSPSIWKSNLRVVTGYFGGIMYAQSKLE